ncbi:MAG: 4-(cytidine 5'-diphospho)-2-C-methyl-D-erythritol kinase [Paracoccaceae bacterium]
MTAVEERAPAKVNLALHVTGQRDDGYHLLDSLVVFADFGDRLTAEPADESSLSVIGPMASDVPVDASNLVLRAARFAGIPARFTLEKNLPVASGIGGGSSNAAAALRALSRLSGGPLPRGAEALGADVPVCLDPRPLRMQGIGERLAPLPGLPDLPAVLVNPGVPLATAQVFARLEQRDGTPMEGPPPAGLGPEALAQWLARQRNDLEPAARQVAPEVSETLLALAAQPGCLLARMSGSGATCFALFAERPAAVEAARAISARMPRWWVQPVTLRGSQ